MDVFEEICGLSCADAAGDVVSKYESEDIETGMDAVNRRLCFLRFRRHECSRVEVILAVDVVKFELTGLSASELSLLSVQLSQSGEILWTGIVGTFMNSDVFRTFPEKESISAIWAPEYCFARAMMAFDLRDPAADFTAQLRALFAVVVVNEFSWRAAVGTMHGVE